ncbi:MAG: DUF4230 domain-containing protein [Clostridia bacterium]|nr:DUF4230 domain-containing protein [Clostridia bacterium]
MMRRFFRHLLRCLVKVLCLCLVFALLPYMSRLLQTLWPDGNAQVVSQILSRNMEASQRLETARVHDTGVMESHVDAFLLGQVQKVIIHYDYDASLGLDLTKVQMRADGHTLYVTIPEVEVLLDSLTPTSVSRDDFWYPLTEKRRQSLLAEEKEKCRAYYLEGGEGLAHAQAMAQTALENFIVQCTDSLSDITLILLPPTDTDPDAENTLRKE